MTFTFGEGKIVRRESPAHTEPADEYNDLHIIMLSPNLSMSFLQTVSVAPMDSGLFALCAICRDAIGLSVIVRSHQTADFPTL